jgi:hypothetical protein
MSQHFTTSAVAAPSLPVPSVDPINVTSWMRQMLTWSDSELSQWSHSWKTLPIVFTV